MLFQKKQKVRKYIEINTSMILVILEVSSGTSYQANKEAAKNDNLSAGTRISHGADAVKDKSTGIVLYNQK
jgi:hypothetical protein